MTLLSGRPQRDGVGRSGLEKGWIVGSKAGSGLLTVYTISLGKRDGVVRRLEVQGSFTPLYPCRIVYLN